MNRPRAASRTARRVAPACSRRRAESYGLLALTGFAILLQYHCIRYSVSVSELGKREEMPTVRIEHAVPDYATWKQVFDSDPVGREKVGVRRYQVFRAVDDPTVVMI